MYAKVEKSVDVDKYDHDWRIVRLENEAVRKENRRMID